MARLRGAKGALGLFERLGVRLKIRKAKLLKNADNTGTVKRGLLDTKVRRPGRSQKRGWKDAADARDAKIREVQAGRRRIRELDEASANRTLTREERQELGRLKQEYGTRRKTATGAYDPETGISGAGVNFRPTPPERWGCAERDALDDINRQRAERGLPPTTPDKLDYSQARDLATGNQKPVDGACQDRIPPERFPDGTTFYTGNPPGQGWEHTRGFDG